MISTRLLAIARCPDCRRALAAADDALACPACARRFARQGDYLDLRPADAFTEQTRYLDDALHTDNRHERLSPPLLGSKVRNDTLRRMLAPGPGDTVIDLGCGSGRTMLWNADLGAALVGLDVSPFFAADALARVDLVLGDLRRLPFGDGAFTKGYALDVMEHLSREALSDVLREASRVLAPGGILFVYSHVRKNSRLARALRWTNQMAHALERWGWLDLRQERLRKSDHLNPLADHPDLERTVAAAGFRIDRIRYYTPVIGGVVENLLVRLVEQAIGRRAARRAKGDAGHDGRDAQREDRDAGRDERETARNERDGGHDGHDTPATAGRGGAARPDPPAPGPARPVAVTAAGAPEHAARLARAEAKRRIAGRGPTYLVLRMLTWLMKWDLWLFGRVRSGPFFVRLVKRPPA